MTGEQQTSADQERMKRIIRRDTTFLIIGAIAASIMSWMELNAGNIEYRGIGLSNVDALLLQSTHNNIIDAGLLLPRQ